MQTERSDMFCSAQTRDVIALLLHLLESLRVSSLRKREVGKAITPWEKNKNRQRDVGCAQAESRAKPSWLKARLDFWF